MRPSRPKTPKKYTDKIIVETKAKDPIQVYCRIRPLDDEDEQVCVKAQDEKTVVLFPPEVSQNKMMKEVQYYAFKRVFNETTTQKEFFDHVCLPLVQGALQGSNGLLFTYGISSSGKTYTINGTPQDGGLLPRSLDVIFNSIKDVQAKKYIFKSDKMNGFEIQCPADALTDQQKELSVFKKNKPKNKREIVGDCSRIPDNTVVKDILPDMCFSVFVSYVEIYNNYIYDLLEEVPADLQRSKARNSKMLREDSTKSVYVFDVQEKEVKTVEEALELYYKGQNCRTIAHTALNTESSRSHCVFTIRIVQAPLDYMGAEVLQDREKITVSQLSIVDLAGSERSSRTKNTGYKLKEAGNINSSLMILRNCIDILRESQAQGISKVKVPYRESKLTHLFKTFLEGEGRLRMVVCINPRADNYKETIHVMEFAEITQSVEITRPTPVSTPIIPGHRFGRGNVYREAAKKAKEHGVPIDPKALLPTIYTLPEFPESLLQPPDNESDVFNLTDFLKLFLAKKNALFEDLDRKQEEFRKQLISIEEENLYLKQVKQTLEMDLEAREQQVRSLEQKLCLVEESNDLMQRRTEEYKRKAEKSEELNIKVCEIERRNLELKREMERMKLRYQEKEASIKKHFKKQLDQYAAELRRNKLSADIIMQEFEKMYANDNYDNLGEANLPSACIPSDTNSESSGPITRRKRTSEDIVELPETRFFKVRSATDVHNNGPSVPISSVNSKNGTDSVFYKDKENRLPVSAQSSRSIVVANPRHRRSTSTGDIWIEHKPIGNLELNTVFQPAMKKKKSVSKLEVKDITNSEKYVLQHQEQDSQGEVETQLFKADIRPSAGGGAQVVFNDVEKLRQVSPPPVYNLRKRSGDNLPLRDTEDRCTVAVECHGLPSKIMKK